MTAVEQTTEAAVEPSYREAHGAGGGGGGGGRGGRGGGGLGLEG